MNRLINEDDVIKAVDSHTVEGSDITLNNDISCILEDIPDVKAVSISELKLAIDEINKLPRSTVTAPTAIIGVNKTHYLIEYPLVIDILNKLLSKEDIENE